MTQFFSKNLEETQAIGQQIYSRIKFPCCVFLTGDLGAGKTSLSQAIIHAAGYQGSVTSPTYNLIHEYSIESGVIYHMDLYRLTAPEELEFLAIEDLWSSNSLFLIEWPEKGNGFLPPADLKISLTVMAETRSIVVEA